MRKNALDWSVPSGKIGKAWTVSVVAVEETMFSVTGRVQEERVVHAWAWVLRAGSMVRVYSMPMRPAESVMVV